MTIADLPASPAARPTAARRKERDLSQSAGESKSEAKTAAEHAEIARLAAERADTWFFRLKGVLDRALGLILLIPAAPVIALLVAAIRATSRGPGIYSQVRVGKGGVNFTMYKLRSMRSDAEAGSGPTWSASGQDPRVTRLGYWLRRLHLDELPQLWNVVRGEMSLVGPRPERPEFVTVLEEQIPGYLNRLAIVPGITGLAQINLPPDSDLDSVRRKLLVDCEYIRTAGFWMDARIIFCTILRMLWIKGPAVTRALGLERIVHLPHSSSPSSSETPAAVCLSTLVMSKDDTVTDLPTHVDYSASVTPASAALANALPELSTKRESSPTADRRSHRPASAGQEA
jgi:lipopolysaccharide/colanic/teichoic acid biosynthesis glycosyltransferase